MTPEEFYTHFFQALKENREEVAIFFNQETEGFCRIRLFARHNGEIGRFCPLTWMSWKKNGEYLYLFQYQKAGETLGLSYHATTMIMDHMDWADPKLQMDIQNTRYEYSSQGS